MAGHDELNVRKLEAQAAGVALAVGSGLAFGTVAIFAKFAYDKGAEAIPLLTGRFVVATLLLLAYQGVTRRPLRVGRRKAGALMLLGAFGYAFEASLFFAALERAPAAVVGLIFYSYPLWTTLAGFTLGLEPVRVRTIAALALGSAGVMTVFSLPDANSAGLWLALAAAVAVAGYFTGAQIVMKDVDPYAGASWTSVGATVALVAVVAATSAPIPTQAMPEVVALGAVTALAYVLMYRALVAIGSTRASIAMMVEPVATVILAAIFLAERITPRIALGAALVIAALPMLVLARKSREPAMPEEEMPLTGL